MRMLQRPSIEKYMTRHEGLSARALAYIIAGHEMHHLQVIQNKYLGKFKA